MQLSLTTIHAAELFSPSINRIANRVAAFLIDRINLRQLELNQDGDWLNGVCMPPSSDLIIALLATLKSGAAYLPIGSTLSVNRIDHILQEAKPTVVINHENYTELGLFDSTEAISFANCKTESAKYNSENVPDGQMLVPANDTRLAGSTGVPKGEMDKIQKI